MDKTDQKIELLTALIREANAAAKDLRRVILEARKLATQDYDARFDAELTASAERMHEDVIAQIHKTQTEIERWFKKEANTIIEALTKMPGETLRRLIAESMPDPQEFFAYAESKRVRNPLSKHGVIYPFGKDKDNGKND